MTEPIEKCRHCGMEIPADDKVIVNGVLYEICGACFDDAGIAYDAERERIRAGDEESFHAGREEEMAHGDDRGWDEPDDVTYNDGGEPVGYM